MRYHSTSYTPDSLKRELSQNSEMVGSSKDDAREVFIFK